jgi:hypothetical protein
MLGMGTTMDLRNCVSGEPKFVALWHQICDKQTENEGEWVAGLLTAGFKAAHPNDGWVNRKDNEVFFSYPQFNDGAGLGDRVMLGWPWDKTSWCAVRLIGKRVTAIGKMVWWQFEEMPNVGAKGSP